MLSLLFAITLAFGAVSAIRRNPSYSGRTLLRTLPAILLSIAAVITLIVAAVHFAAGRSAALNIAAILGVVLFGTFFLIYVIYTVSTPKDARLTHTLPPGAKLVHVHRRRVYRWARVAGAVLLACGLAYLVLPAPAGLIALMSAAFLLFISAILLPILYATSRMMDVALTAMQADPWIHWSYTPEQWEQWSAVRVARVQATPAGGFVLKRDWQKAAWPLLAIAAGVYLFSPGDWIWKTAYLAGVVALMAGIVWLGVRSARSAPERLRAKLRAAAPEVYFGQDGVFADGTLTTWRSTDIFLTSAAVDERSPRSLLFHFEKDVPNPYGPVNIVPIEQPVLIPAGQERDLARLQAFLAERIPSASIAVG